MVIKETTVERNVLYKGRVLEYVVDKVSLEDGTFSEREMVLHPGGVGVIAIDDNEDVCMIRQFRKPYDEVILEIPAGKLDKGESPENCAKRELMEETGFETEELVSLGVFYPTVGYTDEKLHLFLAQGLKKGEARPDEGEYVDVEMIPLDTLCDMVMSGEIRDGKTIAAVLKSVFIIRHQR